MWTHNFFRSCIIITWRLFTVFIVCQVFWSVLQKFIFNYKEGILTLKGSKISNLLPLLCQFLASRFSVPLTDTLQTTTSSNMTHIKLLMNCIVSVHTKHHLLKSIVIRTNCGHKWCVVQTCFIDYYYYYW